MLATGGGSTVPATESCSGSTVPATGRAVAVRC